MTISMYDQESLLLANREFKVTKIDIIPGSKGRTDEQLLPLIEQMLEEQRKYHIGIQKLLEKYQTSRIRVERLMTDSQLTRWLHILELNKKGS